MGLGRITFDYERCKGCNLCTYYCPVNILELDPMTTNSKGYNLIKVTDMDKCIGCSFCALMCPDAVITVYRGGKK